MVIFSGCKDQARNAKVPESTKALPKLDFHKPSSFDSAVGRLREIHEQLNSQDKLPEPISYSVREVSHSHGAGKTHVHYELVGETEHDDHGHDHPHDHSDHVHSDSAAPGHQVVVDVFTELTDIARWLPAIAADGDMPAEDWKQVEEISKQLSGHLETITVAESPSAKHKQYKSESDALETSIGKLETLVK